ncbi:hypothetical protein C8R44DRAFT_8146 [Mycena epipterygia]|nr:hypothetical protein C8R44DRAFT_8146 [Mycena epipterygia]
MQNNAVFPATIPREQIPPRHHSVHNGHRAPVYALGWARDMETVCAMTRSGIAQEVNEDIFHPAWKEKYLDKNDFYPRTLTSTRRDSKIFCFIAFNTASQESLERAASDDELITAAKTCMQVAEDEESTLKWYRFPRGP